MINLEKECELANGLIDGMLKDLDDYKTGKPSQIVDALKSPGVNTALAKLHGVYRQTGDAHMFALMAFRLGAYTALSVQKAMEIK